MLLNLYTLIIYVYHKQWDYSKLYALNRLDCGGWQRLLTKDAVCDIRELCQATSRQLKPVFADSWVVYESLRCPDFPNQQFLWQRWLTKDTVCDICELCQATSRWLKPTFLHTPTNGLVSPRCLDSHTDNFCGVEPQRWQTKPHKPITLPLVHARAVKTS